MGDHTIDHAAVRLSVSDDGDPTGPAVVLLHGLTAVRRYVVMGSSALQRSGHRVIAYDARGHGRSSPAPAPDDYRYDELVADLEAVLDGLGVQRAVLAGASMGAHTLLSFALRAPERVAGIVVITPAYTDPSSTTDPARLAKWDALSDGLRSGGVEGFLAAQGEPRVPGKWADTIRNVITQRLSQHEHPGAVADALHAVPRSMPFDSLEQLRAIDVPAVVVASEDGPDPDHPLEVGIAYAQAIPGARLQRDEPGRSPIAWQGSQLSKIIAEVVSQSR